MLKNLEDAYEHARPEDKPDILKKMQEVAERLDIDLEEHMKIRRREHELEDKAKMQGLTEEEHKELESLRFQRKSLEFGGCEGIVKPTENPNPSLSEEEAKCEWVVEVKRPREEFEEESFRTLCPECPQMRCALCSPEKACATRIVVGCPKGYWDRERKVCLTSTQAHVIYHGKPKPWKGK
jgi:hypothetical protein